MSLDAMAELSAAWSEDVEDRIRAARKISLVAEALGPERARRELVAFLNGAFSSL
jgi:hypothetical protein